MPRFKSSVLSCFFSGCSHHQLRRWQRHMLTKIRSIIGDSPARNCSFSSVSELHLRSRSSDFNGRVRIRSFGPRLMTNQSKFGHGLKCIFGRNGGKVDTHPKMSQRHIDCDTALGFAFCPVLDESSSGSRVSASSNFFKVIHHLFVAFGSMAALIRESMARVTRQSGFFLRSSSALCPSDFNVGIHHGHIPFFLLEYLLCLFPI